MTHGLHLLEIYLKYHLLNKQKFPATFGHESIFTCLVKVSQMPNQLYMCSLKFEFNFIAILKILLNLGNLLGGIQRGCTTRIRGQAHHICRVGQR